MNCKNCGQEMSRHHYSYYNSEANQCDIEIVECKNCQTEEPAQLAALREAGEKMHSLVKEFLSADENTMLGLMVIDALAEWEAANK